MLTHDYKVDTSSVARAFSTLSSHHTPLNRPPNPTRAAAPQLSISAGSGAEAGPAADVVLGVTAERGGEAARFAAKMAEKFPFLHPNRCESVTGDRDFHTANICTAGVQVDPPAV
jgi:hypothetical protein